MINHIPNKVTDESQCQQDQTGLSKDRCVYPHLEDPTDKTKPINIATCRYRHSSNGAIAEPANRQIDRAQHKKRRGSATMNDCMQNHPEIFKKTDIPHTNLPRLYPT